MMGADVDRILRESTFLLDPDLDPELGALRSAILIESEFDVVLTDEQLSLSIWQHPGAFRELLAPYSDRG